ncbi:MAG TPA: glycoside hydrolase family 2 TIM barrel-domain containing protein [Gemmatimonadaceae bacterium]|nr:glycoside hydrolase family 2 TIM barrel-domain containing protein [Gemmatimonadaceae bacterium]
MVAGLALLALPVQAQQLRVIALTDTVSARVEVRVTGAQALAGKAVTGTLTDREGRTVWSGALGALTPDAAGTATVRARIVPSTRPARWTLAEPALHTLVVDAAGARETTRIGFRTFETENGRFLLNGRPQFLMGNAINPPERNLPDSLSENPRFAREYLRFLKANGVNIVRFTRPSEPWFDAADEVGMLVFQGHYGTPRGGKADNPPTDMAVSVAHYTDNVLAPQANHPSVVIYTLANEQNGYEIPYANRNADRVDRFIRALYDTLRQWDDTRLYIGNAGYGFGRGGEVCDLHRYWGWYYNSFLSFYELRDPKLCWRSDAVQPITLTENTGNYTGPDGRYNLASGTKQPESQLNWTGHAPEAEQPRRALAYQAWMAGQAIEITRRLRARNPYLAGLMPFTIAFGNWHGATNVETMAPKPVVAQYRTSYQPILLSWEHWRPQVYAGATLTPTVHVVNDAADGRELRGLALRYQVVDSAGRHVTGGERQLDGTVPFYGAKSWPLSVLLPGAMPTGAYTLRGALVQSGDTVARNETALHVARREAPRPAAGARRIALYDPALTTRRALQALGVATTTVRTPAELQGLDPARDALVVGAGAWDGTMRGAQERLAAFVRAGGRVLVLAQRADRFDTSWLPAAVVLSGKPLDHPLLYPEGRPYRNGMAVNPERPEHPALAGIDRDRLFLWSDVTGWNETKPGVPEVYPVTSGFKLTQPARDLGKVSVIANYDHGLEGLALAELYDGAGSVVLSGFGLVERAGVDPVADRMLGNLARYVATASPVPAHPLVDAKIVWGDYGSERGLVTGIHDGMVLHTVPVVPEQMKARYPLTMDSTGFVIGGARGGWNTSPSVQYVGRGRRPYGPYGFTLGGAVRLLPGSGPLGEGRVHLRVPAGRTTMLTMVDNDTRDTLALTIELNGVTQHARLAPGRTTIETPLAGATSLAIVYRGDRRTVLRETDFR